MKEYICIKKFAVDQLDEWEEVDEEAPDFVIEKDTVWTLDEEEKSGEVRLEQYTEKSYRWIEITQETFEKNFRQFAQKGGKT